MNGNFDFYSTDDNTENLIPYWEQAEKDYILSVEIKWFNALMADDIEWKYWGDRLTKVVREAEEILAEYGIIPNIELLYQQFCVRA